VTYRIDDDRYDEPEEEPRRASWVSTADEPEEAPKRASWATTAVVALLLACIGVGLAFFWRGYGGSVAALPSVATANRPATAPAEKGLSDLQAVQQQLAGQMQAATQLLASQQAEIKRLSDQVAALTGKIDALQQPLTPPPVAKQVAPVRKKPATAAPVAANPAGAAAPPPPPLQLSR
jgi:uncharacterized protein HemX